MRANGPPRAATMQRPPLPMEHLNPYVKNLDPSKVPPVKFQEIIRDGQSTVVARMKIQTPTSHAFILRRLDTGAISSTTMFRAAFPSATDEAERAESLWIKASYNTAGTNKSGNARFAGTWVPPDVAHMLADSYFLAPIITPLTIAQPDPNVVYRKGQKGTQQPTPVATPTAHAPASPAQSITETPPVKRRREGSPATPARSQIPTATQSTPRRGATPQRLSATPSSPRRSTRLASPVPTLPANIVSSATKVTRVLHESPVGPFGSDETIVEEDTTEIHKVAEQNMEEDIREQKELINRLKAEKAELAAREAVKKARASTEERSTAESAGTAPVKRAREDEAAPLTLDIKEPEAGERAIASNRRVSLLGNMRPEQKSLAWGAFLFAAGMGAVSLLPSLPAFF